MFFSFFLGSSWAPQNHIDIYLFWKFNGKIRFWGDKNPLSNLSRMESGSGPQAPWGIVGRLGPKPLAPARSQGYCTKAPRLLKKLCSKRPILSSIPRTGRRVHLGSGFEPQSATFQIISQNGSDSICLKELLGRINETKLVEHLVCSKIILLLFWVLLRRLSTSWALPLKGLAMGI